MRGSPKRSIVVSKTSKPAPLSPEPGGMEELALVLLSRRASPQIPESTATGEASQSIFVEIFCQFHAAEIAVCRRPRQFVDGHDEWSCFTPWQRPCIELSWLPPISMSQSSHGSNGAVKRERSGASGEERAERSELVGVPGTPTI
jgi:hypothetical protein